MKKDKLRDQDKGKINKIDWDQIMNLLIARMINYENKNKNKKFNNAFKAEASEFKFNKDKNKSETKFKKLNKTSTSISTSDNIKKKNLHISIVITVKDSIQYYASISILSLQKKNDKKSIKLK